MKKSPTDMNNGVPIVEISPFDTKTVENKDGDVEVVSILIPQCCREGWDSCVHVLKKQKPIKKNIGL